MLTYNLNNRKDKPIYEYIYERIKEDIRNNIIGAGERLPSKRALAEHLGVSVLTIASSYQMLIDEGYVYSRERSGYFVCAPEEMASVSLGLPNISKRQGAEPAAVPAAQIGAYEKTEPEKNAANILTNGPQGNIGFQFAEYSKIMRRVISKYGSELLIKSPPLGCEILRKAISDYLLR